MSVWSPTKFHPQSGRYCKYQEAGPTTRILDASSWQALEPNQLVPHNHYFKINGRWYVYADIPNHLLFKQPTAVGLGLVEPSDHLDSLLDDLKQIEPFSPLNVDAAEANLPGLPKRVYRGVAYSEPAPIEPSPAAESVSAEPNSPTVPKPNPPTVPKRVYRGVTY